VLATGDSQAVDWLKLSNRYTDNVTIIPVMTGRIWLF